MKNKDIDIEIENFIKQVKQDIKRIMTDQGITQTELAKRLGNCSKQSVSDLLKSGNIGLLTILRIIKALDCKLVWNIQSKLKE